MTTWKSDHFSPDFIPETATVTAPTAVPTRKYVPHASVAGLGLRYRKAFVDLTNATMADEDQIRFMTFKSADRLARLWLSTPGGFTAGTAMDLGVFQPGQAHNGPSVERVLFLSNQALDAGQNRLEAILPQALDTWDRGRMLWEMVGNLTGDPASDPRVEYDITGVLETPGAAGDTILLEAYYVPAG